MEEAWSCPALPHHQHLAPLPGRFALTSPSLGLACPTDRACKGRTACASQHSRREERRGKEKKNNVALPS
jgi:hypothetical protein